MKDKRKKVSPNSSTIRRALCRKLFYFFPDTATFMVPVIKK